jgi:hypothetical protein
VLKTMRELEMWGVNLAIMNPMLGRLRGCHNTPSFAAFNQPANPATKPQGIGLVFNNTQAEILHKYKLDQHKNSELSNCTRVFLYSI